MYQLRKLGCALAICAFLALAPHAAWAQEETVVEVPTSENAPAVELPADAPAVIWRLPARFTTVLVAGYNENANTTRDAQGSFFTSANINVFYEFGSTRSRGSLSTGTGLTYFPELSRDIYDPNFFLKLTLTHQATLRLLLNARINFTYSEEPDFANDASPNRRGGSYLNGRGSLSATYQYYPRLSSVSTYTFPVFQYRDQADSGFENRVEHRLSQAFRFLVLPTTSGVGEYRIALIKYNGEGGDALTQSLLAGVDHTISASLSGSLRGGVELRSDERNVGNKSQMNPHAEINVNYAFTGKLILSLSGNYSTEESVVGDDPRRPAFRGGLQLNYVYDEQLSLNLSSYYRSGDTSLRTGLRVNYVFSPRLQGNVSCFYRSDEVRNRRQNNIGEFTETALDFGVGLRYTLTQHIFATAGYNRTQVESDFFLRSFTRSRYFGGLNFTF